MSFEDVLTRAIAMLQRQGRVSYRVRKRQFDLNHAPVAVYRTERTRPPSTNIVVPVI